MKQVKFQGSPITLEGNTLSVGDKLPDFSVTTNDLGRLSTIAMERGLSYPFARTYTLALSIIFK